MQVFLSDIFSVKYKTGDTFRNFTRYFPCKASKKIKKKRKKGWPGKFLQFVPSRNAGSYFQETWSKQTSWVFHVKTGVVERHENQKLKSRHIIVVRTNCVYSLELGATKARPWRPTSSSSSSSSSSGKTWVLKSSWNLYTSRTRYGKFPQAT